MVRDTGVVSAIEQPAPSAATLADLRARRSEILEVARRRGAGDVRVFGSVARGTAAADSDVDLLVSFAPGRSLFDLTEAELRAHVRERVLADAVAL